MNPTGRLVLVFVLLFAVFGCGKKTRPVPPQTLLPAPVNDLRYILDVHGVTLAWSTPQRTRTGDRFEGKPDYVISRSVVAADNYCPGCPVQYSEQQILKGADFGGTATLTYREGDLKPGYRYYYKVSARIGALFQGLESNIVSFWWQVPVLAPENLAIKEGDGQLTLTWQPPAALTDHSPVAGNLVYWIYRSTDGLNFVHLDGQVAALIYTDSDVQNGAAFAYQVRAVRVLDDTSAPGLPSPTVSGSPRDMTPPAIPSDLNVVRKDRSAQLFWDLVTDADLAGYRIYRRSGSASTAERIGEVKAMELSFVDPQVPANQDVFYSISAIDSAEPPNESKTSPEVVSRFQR